MNYWIKGFTFVCPENHHLHCMYTFCDAAWHCRSAFGNFAQMTIVTWMPSQWCRKVQNIYAYQSVRRRFWCHEFLPARHDSQRNWTDFLSVDEKPRLSIQHLQEWGIRGLSHFARLCAGEIFFAWNEFHPSQHWSTSAYTLLIGIYFMSSMIGWFFVFHFWLGVHRLPAPNIANELRRLQVLPSSLRWSTLSPGAHRWPQTATNLEITRWPLDLMEFLRPSAGSRFFFGKTPSRDSTTNFQDLK